MLFVKTSEVNYMKFRWAIRSKYVIVTFELVDLLYRMKNVPNLVRDYCRVLISYKF